MKLKICGVKTPEEAEALKKTNVDYIGLNFVPSSPRCISLETAQSLMAVFHGSPIKMIALFQDQPLEMVDEYARRLDVAYIQLHGDESAEYARSLPKPVIRAIPIVPDAKASDIMAYIKDYPADLFVLDRASQGQGTPVDLRLAGEVIRAFPDRICLAGGLTPDTLQNTVSHVRPYAIDISSGVRTGENIDSGKVAQCLHIIGEADSSLM